MDQTQELDVVLLAYTAKKSMSSATQKKNVNEVLIKKKSRRRSCKPYFKFVLRIGVITAICAIAFWTYDVSKTMMRSFWERPDSFTVDTLK